MKKLTRPCIPVQQPIGEFFLTSLSAKMLVRQVAINPRRDSSPDNPNVQRDPSPSRIREISQYVRDPDATFPTAIIVSVSSDQTIISETEIEFRSREGDDSDEFVIGELLDGQHRINGLRMAMEHGTDLSQFFLPVVVMVDLDLAEKAYVFSIINSKQTPVSKSLIYDLFGLSQTRSPYLTCHQVARAMNSDESGPFGRGLKMLGRKTQREEILTQGSFVKYLLRLISRRPDLDTIAIKRSEDIPKDDNLPFNAFWRKNRDDLILTAMTNYFSAIRDVFPEEWDYRAYLRREGEEKTYTPVLRRTVGYEALMRALEMIWPDAKASARIDYGFFLEKAMQFKTNSMGVARTTEKFGSSSADAGRLADLFVKGTDTAS